MLSRMLSTLTGVAVHAGLRGAAGPVRSVLGRRRVACANPGQPDPTHAPPSIDAPDYPGQVTDLAALTKVA